MAKITRQQRKIVQNGKIVGIGLFALTMVIGFLTGLLWFARPSVSKLENRNLSAFPAFTWNRFWDGSWFNGISTWYADTYPGRESLVADANAFKNMYGIHSGTQVMGNVAVNTADEIPEENNTINRKQYEQTDVPENYDVSQDVQSQIMQGQLIQDGSCYGLYYFVNDAAQAYISMMNQAAKDLEGTTQVYSILVPNNSGAMLDEATLEGTGGSNQEQAIHYYYTQYDEAVAPVPTIDVLREHNDEYLYFHGDHHWTSLGAYYAYRSFCETKGIEPMELDEWKSETFEPYYGSYRSITTDLKEDSVTGYIPNSTNTTKIFDAVGEYVPLDLNNTYTEGAVFDTNEWIDATGQYLRFINGDRGLQEIDNPKISDGTSCVVVKESYGNAFVPFLVDHYDKIYVIDYRYADGSILDFCKDNEIDDLLFVNNIQIIGSVDVVNSIGQMMQTAKSADSGNSSENNADPNGTDENPSESSDEHQDA